MWVQSNLLEVCIKKFSYIRPNVSKNINKMYPNSTKMVQIDLNVGYTLSLKPRFKFKIIFQSIVSTLKLERDFNELVDLFSHRSYIIEKHKKLLKIYNYR